MLLREAKHELTVVVGIDCLTFLVCVKQLCNFVSQLFHLLKRVSAGFLRVQYEHKKEIALESQPVLNVRKVTDQLAGVETARRPRTRIGAKVQHQVEGFVGPGNDRSSLTKAVENQPAVSTRAGISLQLGSVVNFTFFVRNGRKSGICPQNICSSRSIFTNVASALQGF
jgi:hypothetical protein